MKITSKSMEIEKNHTGSGNHDPEIWIWYLFAYKGNWLYNKL